MTEAPLPVPVGEAERPALNGLVRSLGAPHPSPFLAEITVAPAHLSRLIPHCNNVEFVRWLDRAAELHADSIGQGRATLTAEDRAWFVARHEVDYRAEAFEGERLVVATWVRNARKSLSWRDSLIVRPFDRTIVCRAATLWIHVDLRSRRASAPGAAGMARFEPLERASP
jgi:acyl-CoA thioester hydrolase